MSPITARHWSKEAQLLNKQGNAGTLLDPDGKGPKPGQLWKNTDLARTYKQVADHGAMKGECVTIPGSNLQGSMLLNASSSVLW